jgi:hypothetical protein
MMQTKLALGIGLRNIQKFDSAYLFYTTTEDFEVHRRYDTPKCHNGEYSTMPLGGVGPTGTKKAR